MDQKGIRDIAYYVGIFSQVGFTIIFTILFFVLIYKLIEKMTGPNSIVFIICVLLGIIGGFYNAYQILIKKK